MSAQDPMVVAKLATELEAIKKTLEKSQVQQDSVTRPKGDGSTSMVNVPYTRVQIVDERGDNKEFLKNIEGIRKATENTDKLSKDDRKKQLRILDDVKGLIRTQTRLSEEIKEEQKESKEQEIRDIVTSIQRKEERRGFGQRVFDIVKKGGLFNALTAVPRALVGGVADKITVGLRESVGLPLQAFGLIQGEAFERWNKDLEERERISLAARERSNELTLEQRRDALMKEGRSREEIASALSQFAAAQEKRIQGDFSLSTRANRGRSGVDDPSDLINKMMQQIGPRGKPTFTEEERETQSRAQSAALSRLGLEGEERNALFRQLSDPRSSNAMNVRLIESKVTMDSAAAQQQKKPDSGGLFGAFTGLLGIGTIISSVGTAIGGVLSSLAALAAASAAVAANILAIGAAAGSVYTAFESFNTITEINDLELQRMKQDSAMRTKLADFDAKRLKTEGDLVVKRDQARRREANERTQISMLEDKLRERDEQDWVGSLQTGAGRLMGLERSYSDIEQELIERRRKRQKLQSQIVDFDMAIADQKKKTERVEVEAQTTVAEKTQIEKVVESKMPEVAQAGSQDEVVKELKHLSKMLERVYTDTTKEVAVTRNSQVDGMLNALAGAGPMNFPSTFFSRPPGDHSNTQGVIKS
jgi:hypothetical protein